MFFFLDLFGNTVAGNKCFVSQIFNDSNKLQKSSREISSHTPFIPTDNFFCLYFSLANIFAIHLFFVLSSKRERMATYCTIWFSQDSHNFKPSRIFLHLTDKKAGEYFF